MNKKIFIIVFLLIIIFAVFTRFWWLDEPKNYIFDEVYHAFTAQEMLHNKKEAWEWWNSAPSGFAYEWLHPPLSKLIMVSSMQIFGENHFGWRFPSALLGVGSIILIYLLALELFNAKTAFIAGYLATIEGLLLAQSRIAMNDIYVLFFLLLAFYLFSLNLNMGTKRSSEIKFALWLWISISLGLAISSKWSAFFWIDNIRILVSRAKNLFFYKIIYK